MKNKFFSLVISLTLASLLLSGCAGLQLQSVPQAARSIDFYSTMQGMRSTVLGVPGTFLMQKDSLVIAAWPYQGQYAFIVLQRDGAVLENLANLGGGLKLDWRNFTTWVTSLERSGWRTILPEDLPPAMVATLTSYATALIAIGERTLPSIFLIPGGMIPDVDIPGQGDA